MRIVVLLAGAALGLSLVTACGSESDRVEDSDLEAALLTVDHLGEGFVVDDEEDDDEEEELGCLDAIDSGDGLGGRLGTDDDGEVEIAFELEGELGFPAVFQGIKSFDDEDDAEEVLEEMSEELEGCDHVEETDDEGTTLELDIETSSEVTAGSADDQLNVDAAGEISDEGFEFPFNFSFHFARVDNNLVAVFFVNLGEVGTEGEDLLEAAVDRLEAVVAGDELPAPEPLLAAYSDGSDGSVDEEEEPDAAVTLPLDGGTYTWASGISMTLTVDRVEPYGHRSDFCGDGSCGVVEKDDVRLVLRYEVTVPDDAAPFDPYSCPGSLHIASGNDDEALGGVLGEYDSSIEGTMLPGTTKHGFSEYYVKKEFADEELYVESTCGGEYGETVFFRGFISEPAL